MAKFPRARVVRGLYLVRSMRSALVLGLIGVAVVAQAKNVSLWNDAKKHHYLTLDNGRRARAVEIVSSQQVTKAQFREMQQHYHPRDFDTWTARLRQIRPGMTEREVETILRPAKNTAKFWGPGLNYIYTLSDAYFAVVRFSDWPHRVEEVTPPLAVTYEIVPAGKAPKT